MVKYLLDTSVWFMLSQEPERLPDKCVQLAQTQAELGLSCVSLREIAWKQAQGKLDLGKPLLAWFSTALTPQIRLLTITPEVAADSAALPQFPNKDPYDQIIVATARQNKLTIISNDDAWKNYAGARILYFKPTAPGPT
ncbi:MAG: type II toxin-antitoxin system VapC family toxin [Verrucomicrobia bacterium]|nr:type II toxin-antitoxin system VapC family toxin [Verrucomicrobiota bacterium]